MTYIQFNNLITCRSWRPTYNSCEVFVHLQALLVVLFTRDVDQSISSRAFPTYGISGGHPGGHRRCLPKIKYRHYTTATLLDAGGGGGCTLAVVLQMTYTIPQFFALARHEKQYKY